MYQLTEGKGGGRDIDKCTCLCTDHLQDTQHLVNSTCIPSGCQWVGGLEIGGGKIFHCKHCQSIRVV